MADIDYRTGGGGSTLTTRGAGYQLPAAAMPEARDFSGLAGALIAKKEEEERRRRAEELADKEADRENQRMAMRLAAQRMSPAAAGPEEAPAGDAKFVKMLNIGGSMPGYVPAQAWEPGAISAGYMPAGQKAPSPTQAHFGGTDATPSGASLSRSDLPSYGAGESAFGSTPDVSNAQTRTGPGLTAGNPYATGAAADAEKRRAFEAAARRMAGGR